MSELQQASKLSLSELERTRIDDQIVTFFPNIDVANTGQEEACHCILQHAKS